MKQWWRGKRQRREPTTAANRLFPQKQNTVTASHTMSRRNLSRVQVAATQGTQPFSRVKSSSTVADGKLFLFGGFDEEDKLDGNVYILDIGTLTWQTHKHHVYREGHSSLSISNGDVLVYGGISEDYTTAHASYISDDLMVYNVGTNEWRRAFVNGLVVPPQRSRHAACLSSDGTKMFISGGQEHEEESPLDDLYCYDIRTGVWDGPRRFIGRFDHSITFYDDKIWAFGGLTNEMAHATEISYFDLVTNTTGSIKMNDLPKLEGDHIYMPTMNESLILDVVVPLWTFEKVEPCIGLYDLKSLRWQAVLTGAFKPLLGYRWRHTIVHKGKLLLIGYPLNSETNDNSFDYKLSDVVQLDLGDLGINESTPQRSTQGGVVSDLSKLLFQDDFSDFKIIGVNGDVRPSINAKFIDSSPLDMPFELTNNETYIKSTPIPVHSIILLARWPHFHRIVTSGMTEAHTNTLFIPEPIEWITALIEYLYTDEITQKADTNILTGLLILSNVYDLPRLRSLCIQSIYSQGFKIRNVLKIWSRAHLVGEQVMAHNASTFCFYNWGKIVKTKQFRELSKEELITLCQEVEHDSFIVNNKQTAIIGRGTVQQALEHGDLNTTTEGFTLNPLMNYNNTGFRSAMAKEVDGDEDIEDQEFSESDTENTQVGSRFTTPQASVYLGNPQMGMNSLGERHGDDSDMEEEEDL